MYLCKRGSVRPLGDGEDGGALTAGDEGGDTGQARVVMDPQVVAEPPAEGG